MVIPFSPLNEGTSGKGKRRAASDVRFRISPVEYHVGIYSAVSFFFIAQLFSLVSSPHHGAHPHAISFPLPPVSDWLQYTNRLLVAMGIKFIDIMLLRLLTLNP